MKKTHGRQKLHGKKNRERKKLKNLTLRAGPSRPKQSGRQPVACQAGGWVWVPNNYGVPGYHTSSKVKFGIFSAKAYYEQLRRCLLVVHNYLLGIKNKTESTLDRLTNSKYISLSRVCDAEILVYALVGRQYSLHTPLFCCFSFHLELYASQLASVFSVVRRQSYSFHSTLHAFTPTELRPCFFPLCMHSHSACICFL